MKKPRVLLADDNMAVANALRLLLQADCELVGVVHDGRALVEAARELRPDVIVTDLSMPVMDGLSAARQLKRDGATARIIFLTVHAEPHLAADALGIGASAYISKLAAGEDLVDAIHKALAADDA